LALPLDEAWPIKRETTPASAGEKGVQGAVLAIRRCVTTQFLFSPFSFPPVHITFSLSFLNQASCAVGDFRSPSFFLLYPSTTQLDVGGSLDGF